MTLDSVTSFSRIRNMRNTCKRIYHKVLLKVDVFSGGKLEISEVFTYLFVVSCVLKSK